MKEKIEWIDAVKSVAIIGVVLFHFYAYLYNAPRFYYKFGVASLSELVTVPSSFLNGIAVFFTAIFKLGFQGVHLFIIASGACLMLSYLKRPKDKRSFKSWFGRRFVKIFPMYWLVLFLVVFNFRTMSFEFTAGNIITHFFGIHNFFPQYMNSIISAFWFIGLIIQLYLIFPFLIKLCHKIGFEKLVIYSIIFTFISRYISIYYIDPLHYTFTFGGYFGNRLGEFVFGMYLGCLLLNKRREVEKFISNWKVFLGALLLYIVSDLMYFSKPTAIFADPLAAISLFFVVVYMLKKIPRLILSFINFIGRYSYAIYLTHTSLLFLIFFKVFVEYYRITVMNLVLMSSLYAVVVIVLSVLLTKTNNGIIRKIINISQNKF